LLELLIVIAVIALGTAGVALAMRDSTQTQIDREALRLSALLDAARSQSRASGKAVIWQAYVDEKNEPAMRWQGQSHKEPIPTAWLDSKISVETNRPVVLGPDPVIAPTRIRLTLGSQSRDVVSDGVGAFKVEQP